MSKPLGPYSPAAGGLAGQTRQVFANLLGVLQANGAALTDIVKTNVFLINMDDFAAMNTIYVEEFGDHRPARSTVAVAGLPLGAVIEIEAWAYLGQ
jgi:2-iminobutanoate/2-iminopropanoate deaminase